MSDAIKFQQFIDMAEDIYYKGMLDFESICEQIIDKSNSPVGTYLQSVLDKAQLEFEKRMKNE